MSPTFPPRARGEYLLFRTQLYLFSIICWAAPIQDTVQIGVDAHDTIIFGAWTCNTVFSLPCTMRRCPAWLKVLVKSVDQSSPAPPTVHHTCTALHAHPGLTCVIFRPGAAVGFHRQWTLVVFCAETLGNITATLPTTQYQGSR